MQIGSRASPLTPSSTCMHRAMPASPCKSSRRSCFHVEPRGEGASPVRFASLSCRSRGWANIVIAGAYAQATPYTINCLWPRPPPTALRRIGGPITSSDRLQH
jgi:hypothetical protein